MCEHSMISGCLEESTVAGGAATLYGLDAMRVAIPRQDIAKMQVRYISFIPA